MPDGFTVSACNVQLSRGKVLVLSLGMASGKSDAEWMVPPYVHLQVNAGARQAYSIMPQVIYRRLWARPDLCREATVPCRFIPLDLGRGVIPFEALQCSRRDPLGP